MHSMLPLKVLKRHFCFTGHSCAPDPLLRPWQQTLFIVCQLLRNRKARPTRSLPLLAMASLDTLGLRGRLSLSALTFQTEQGIPPSLALLSHWLATPPFLYLPQHTCVSRDSRVLSKPQTGLLCRRHRVWGQQKEPGLLCIVNCRYSPPPNQKTQ